MSLSPVRTLARRFVLASMFATGLATGLAACSGSSSGARTEPSPAPTPPSEPVPATTSTGSAVSDAPPPLDVSALGQPCGEDGLCTVGSCERYLGIAGARGPELSSCEIRCSDEAPCPAGTRCIKIADGPGEVCRP
jgi:hypothetical protein